MDSNEAKKLMLKLQMAVPSSNIVKVVFHSERGIAIYKVDEPKKKVKGGNKRWKSNQ